MNGHPEDDIKRQRTQYNGDQLYSNVSSRPNGQYGARYKYEHRHRTMAKEKYNKHINIDGAAIYGE